MTTTLLRYTPRLRADNQKVSLYWRAKDLPRIAFWSKGDASPSVVKQAVEFALHGKRPADYHVALGTKGTFSVGAYQINLGQTAAAVRHDDGNWRVGYKSAYVQVFRFADGSMVGGCMLYTTSGELVVFFPDELAAYAPDMPPCHKQKITKAQLSDRVQWSCTSMVSTKNLLPVLPLIRNIVVNTTDKAEVLIHTKYKRTGSVVATREQTKNGCTPGLLVVFEPDTRFFGGDNLMDDFVTVKPMIALRIER